MTNADFYILSTASEQQRYLFACKLIEKIYRSQVFCYVLTESEQQSRTLDELLWTFRPNSFVPHQIYTGQIPDSPQTILISHLPMPEAWQQVVLNLSLQAPVNLLQIQRLLEIIDNRDYIKQQARARYRYYQQQNIELATHKI